MASLTQSWSRACQRQGAGQEVFRGRVTGSVVVESARVVAQMAAFTGVVAGFWHIFWIAGVGMLAAGLLAVAVHSAG